jgi:predicted deacylase
MLCSTLLGSTASGTPSSVSTELSWQGVEPGSLRHVDVQVPAGVDAGTFIPTTIFRGRKAGPVLCITAGVHGYEFPPILAAQRLLKSLSPELLSGTVLLVRIAHIPAFQRRSLFFNPMDGKNLNRVFPGRADGTQSERIADVISREVIARADLHIDLHSGDGSEDLSPYVGVYGGLLAREQLAKSKLMGMAFGFPVAVLYRMETRQQVDGGRSCNRQAVAGGKPTLLVEMGAAGRRDEKWVAGIENGVLSALRALGMLPGPPSEAAAPIWCDGERSVVSEHAGILYPAAAAGQQVRAGQVLARVTDFTGSLLREYVSPVDGVVLQLQAAPPISPGEAIAAVAPLLKGAP